MALKIDSHQHFWKFDAARDVWITENMSAIKKDFLPDDLAPVLKDAGIDGCVAVQSVDEESYNDFLIDLVLQNSFIKGVVGWLDFTAPDISKRLEYYRQFHMIKGFRYGLQGHPQRNLILTENFVRNLSLLEPYDYTYDLLIFPDQLGYVGALVAQFPKQKFVLDHLGKPHLKHTEFGEWKRGIQRLAQFENVYCKISGLVTEADWSNWQQADYPYVLDIVTNAFGIDRLLFGSDWPVCQLATSYHEVKGLIEDYYTSFSPSEKAKIFGGNAVIFYSL